MRILKREQICQITATRDDQGDALLTLEEVAVVCEEQARETCKETGERMMRRSDFEAMRLVLLRGEMP